MTVIIDGSGVEAEVRGKRLAREDVTAGGLRVLREIVAFQAERGYGPSYKEIGRRAGIRSKGHVSYCLRQLVADGLLTKDDTIARSAAATEYGLWALEGGAE